MAICLGDAWNMIAGFDVDSSLLRISFAHLRSLSLSRLLSRSRDDLLDLWSLRRLGLLLRLRVLLRRSSYLSPLRSRLRCRLLRLRESRSRLRERDRSRDRRERFGDDPG